MVEERILLVQLADIGDLVLATPAMDALRESKPGAVIDLCASAHAAPIVPKHLVDRIVLIDKGAWSGSRALLAAQNLRKVLSFRGQQYDAVVIFHHFTLKAGVLKFRLIAKASGARRIIGLKNHNVDFLTDFVVDDGFGAKHEAQYWLDLVGMLGADSRARPALLHREPLTRPAATGQGKPTVSHVVIHAGSGGYSAARRWPPERFAEVAGHLHSCHRAEIVLVGHSGDDSDQVGRSLEFPAHNLVGKTTLPQLADVIHGADLFIGADSGVMHIAAAVGTPVISIFGPSNHRAWQPWTPSGKSVVIRSEVECSPCSYVAHSIGAREGCSARTCMKLVSTSAVVETASRILNGGGVPVRPGRLGPEQRSEAARPWRINVLGVPVDGITNDQWIELIGNWIGEGSAARHMCTVNPEFIMIARRDPIFSQILARADLCVPDGVGLLWASRFLGSPIPERVTGSDGVPLIAGRAAEKDWRIFFLGAAEGVAARAAEILGLRYAGLQVAGCYAGGPSEAEEDAIVAMINDSAADILFVAYGAPQQDKWIARNLPRLEVKVAMGIGGSLDFIAGVVPRAPRWMRRYGIEWLYRLIRQPWRLRRMSRLPRFVLAVLRERDN